MGINASMLRKEQSSPEKVRRSPSSWSLYLRAAKWHADVGRAEDRQG